MAKKRQSSSKQRAERHGRFAEQLAAWSYRLRGFRVVAERYRTPAGEIDLIVRRRSLLVFAEVKARRTFDEAIYALQPAQQSRLVRAAEAYLRDHPPTCDYTTRFDLIAIRPWRWPRHIEDAWRMD